MLNNQAYTLLEMMVVLMIIAALFFIYGFSYIKMLDNQAVDNAVNIILSGYENLKTDAIANASDVSLIINNTTKTITLNSTDQKEQRQYSDRVTITSNFGNNYDYQKIDINAHGNIKRAGSINVASGDIKKTITFSIGLGGYNVK